MRYIGGKYRIRKQLVDYLSEYFTETNCFVEPFVGSANITTWLLEENGLLAYKLEKIILNDFHTDLAMMWNEVISGKLVLPDTCTEEEYERLRNESSSGLRGFIGHGCSFGGIWFSKFAKTNDGRNYCLNAKNSIMNTVKCLKGYNVIIENKSYEEIEIPDGALVYCDPPYKNTCKPGMGNDFNHKKFWGWIRELSKRCFVFISEYESPEDFECVLEIPVSLDMGKRENRIEKLFRYNYGLR